MNLALINKSKLILNEHLPVSLTLQCLINSMIWSTTTNGPWKQLGGGNMLQSWEAAGGIGNDPPLIKVNTIVN